MSLRNSGKLNTTRISSSSGRNCFSLVSISSDLKCFPSLSLSQFVFFLKVQPFISQTSLSLLFVLLFLDSLAPPSELLEMCELSLEKMGAVFADTNVYMLHMMYQAMGICLYMQDWDGAMSYGEKIIQPYR